MRRTRILVAMLLALSVAIAVGYRPALRYWQARVRPAAPATISQAAAAIQPVSHQASGYLTPQQAFAAYSSAVRDGDFKTAFACLTPELRDYEVFELSFALSMSGENRAIVDRHLDQRKLEATFQREPATEDEDDEVRAEREDRNRKALVAAFKDKEAFYCEGNAKSAAMGGDDLPDGKLANVKITGQRARGTITTYVTGLSRTSP